MGVRELKNSLSATLRDVQDGEIVEITDHGRPVARALRAAQRQSMARIVRVRTALLQVAMIDVDRASAASLGSDPGVFLSYDQRLVAAAVGHGLAVNSPT